MIDGTQNNSVVNRLKEVVGLYDGSNWPEAKQALISLYDEMELNIPPTPAALWQEYSRQRMMFNDLPPVDQPSDLLEVDEMI